MRAIDQQTLTQSFRDKGIAIDGKLNTEDEAFAADFADKVELGGELDQAFPELSATGADVFEKLLIFDDFQKFKSGSTNQRAATEGGAVQAGGNAGSHGFSCKDCAER